MIEECTINSCISRESCGSCTSDNTCLWCPSLARCVPGTLYGVSYNFGQCLGWRNDNCDQALCEDRTNCSSCQELSECGWCNDPADTGLGQCRLGGFGGPQNQSSCMTESESSGILEVLEEWQFTQCSGEFVM